MILVSGISNLFDLIVPSYCSNCLSCNVSFIDFSEFCSSYKWCWIFTCDHNPCVFAKIKSTQPCSQRHFSLLAGCLSISVGTWTKTATRLKSCRNSFVLQVVNSAHHEIHGVVSHEENRIYYARLSVDGMYSVLCFFLNNIVVGDIQKFSV